MVRKFGIFPEFKIIKKQLNEHVTILGILVGISVAVALMGCILLAADILDNKKGNIDFLSSKKQQR